jgi:hypothetical protein
MPACLRQDQGGGIDEELNSCAARPGLFYPGTCTVHTLVYIQYTPGGSRFRVVFRRGKLGL